MENPLRTYLKFLLSLPSEYSFQSHLKRMDISGYMYLSLSLILLQIAFLCLSQVTRFVRLSGVRKSHPLTTHCQRIDFHEPKYMHTRFIPLFCCTSQFWVPSQTMFLVPRSNFRREVEGTVDSKTTIKFNQSERPDDIRTLNIKSCNISSMLYIAFRPRRHLRPWVDFNFRALQRRTSIRGYPPAANKKWNFQLRLHSHKGSLYESFLRSKKYGNFSNSWLWTFYVNLDVAWAFELPQLYRSSHETSLFQIIRLQPSSQVNIATLPKWSWNKLQALTHI